MMFWTLVLGGALIAIGLPLFLALLVPAIFFLGMSHIPMQIMAQRLVLGVDDFSLLAIPFFILAGNLMNSGGITVRIFNLADALVGSIRGSMGQVTTFANVIMSGMSGSAIADAAGLGPLALEAMTRSGWRRPDAMAVVGASATVGPIIPPSIIMVIYAASAGGVSVAKLFLDGIVPGILMGGSVMAIIYLKARSHPKAPPWTGIARVAKTLCDAALPLMMPVIIVGGILAGIATPTEAAALGALYAIILGGVIYRELTWKRLKRVLIDTVVTTSMVFSLMAASSALAWTFAFDDVPRQIAHFLMQVTPDRTLLLLLIMGIYLILGMIMEGVAIVVVTVPLLVPVLQHFAIDPVYFGVLLAINISIGALTPPIGMVMLVLTSVGGITVRAFTRACLPYLAVLVLCLFIFVLFPSVITAVPKILAGG